MKQKRSLDQIGLRLSRQALRVLKERGIFVQAAVSLEHQHLAKRYVISDDHSFIWSSLACHYGLPATPEWGPWMISQLQQQKRIQPLLAFGYAAVTVKAKRKELLALLRRGLRSNQLAFPVLNGAVEWPEIQLAKKTA